jgi:hypothetical protein
MSKRLLGLSDIKITEEKSDCCLIPGYSFCYTIACIVTSSMLLRLGDGIAQSLATTLWTGRYGTRTPMGARDFIHINPDRPGAHPALCTVGIGTVESLYYNTLLGRGGGLICHVIAVFFSVVQCPFSNTSSVIICTWRACMEFQLIHDQISY